MPITKTGRYSMNPAYAEALDRAAQEKDDEQDNAQDAAGKDDGNGAGKSDGKADGKDGEKGAPKKGAVKRIEIEPAENGGFVSRTQREQSDDDDGGTDDGWAPPYQEPELRAHPDSVDLMKFLGRELAK
jgi:hypothetical protein